MQEGENMELKTPFISTFHEHKKLQSFCPACDALMTVELEDPKDLKSDLIQVCWACGYKQPVKTM